MAKYNHILVAIDLTSESEKILEQAIELGKQNAATLSLVHVLEHIAPLYDDGMGFPEPPDLEQDMTQKATDNMQKIREDNGIGDADIHICTGSAKHEIVNLAKEIKADLIVVGSHGRHGLQLLLGSTANGILHLATCDVLAVRVGQD